MQNRARGRYVPDYSKLVSANEPRLREPVPALQRPIESANLNLAKQIVTLNRAGSHRGNPILKGLGIRTQYKIDAEDEFLGLYLFQDTGNLRGNLIRQASAAQRVATFDFVAGFGRTVSGDAASGAVRNFCRWVSKAGACEREFWIKDYDPDIVTLNGEAALDEDLVAVEIVVPIVDVSRTWIEVNADFMPSWNDEFQVLHRRTDEDEESGFQKSYGGALVVSFFDKTPGTEGVGVRVNPINQKTIQTLRSIQIQNTVGLKEITARFRSEEDSTSFVDVQIKVRVIAPDVESCEAPIVLPCTDLYLKAGVALPAGLPAIASVPGEQVVAGVTGTPLASPLLIVTIRGASVGAAPILRVKKLSWVASAPALAGARLAEAVDDEDYLPLVQSSSTPNPGAPYGSPHRFTVAFAITALNADNVALLVLTLVDDDHVSEPIVIAGPKARALQFFPIGGTGGGPTCSPY